MKKIMAAFAVLSTALALTGCGGKPKIPADTVAAAYVDLETSVDNLVDVIECVIDELPKEMRKDAEKDFKEFKKEHGKDIKNFGAEWLVVTVGKGKYGPEIAAVLKCDLDGKIPSFDNKKVRDLLPFDEVGEERGCKLYRVMGLPVPLSKAALVKDDYIILADSEDRLKSLIALYKDGKGETSDDFDDLCDIGGDTIARIQTAKVETLLKIAGEEDSLDKFGEACGDKKLAEMIKDIENVTLDINLSDDIFGSVLTVDAGSKEFAKVVESAFNILAFSNRVFIDMLHNDGARRALVFATRKIPGAGELFREFANDDNAVEAFKASAELLREAAEVDRSGSTVKYTVEIDTEDFLEKVVPVLCK